MVRETLEPFRGAAMRMDALAVLCRRRCALAALLFILSAPSVVSAPGLSDLDVLGMNFLSKLESWRVEGRTLILVPHHPQPSSES